MAYSKEVNDRFYGVLNNPGKFSVGRYDPKDPAVATEKVAEGDSPEDSDSSGGNT